MDNQFEKSISFRKHTGKESEIKIVSETSINKGNYGEIFDTVVEVDGKRKRFIVKKYFDEEISEVDPSSDRSNAETNAQLVFENYSLAKEARLKVFPTFRIAEDKKSILMTAELSEDQMCISSNNKKNESDIEKTFVVEEIENQELDRFLASFFEEGLKAGRKGIQIYRDAPFFILSKSKPTKIDFIFGDFDMLKRFEHNSVEISNIIELEKALIRFSEKYIDKTFEKTFLEKIEFYSKKAFDEARKDGLK